MIREARKKWMLVATKLLGRVEVEVEEETRTLKVDPADLPYRLRDQFLTPAEDRLMRRLDEAIGEFGIVCPKPRLSDVLYIPQAHLHVGDAVRMDRKTVDFLICSRSTRHPVCALQLDVWLEAEAKYQQRDEFLELALSSAGLSVLHIRSDQIPTVAEIWEHIIPLVDERSEWEEASVKQQSEFSGAGQGSSVERSS